MYAVQGTVGFMPCGTSVVSSLMIRDLGGTTKLACTRACTYTLAPLRCVLLGGGPVRRPRDLSLIHI